MRKDKAFPNPIFKSQNEYLEFSIKHKVFGKEAYQLKKEMNKKTKIPEPKVFKK